MAKREKKFMITFHRYCSLRDQQPSQIYLKFASRMGFAHSWITFLTDFAVHVPGADPAKSWV